jgi:hypothetical protein
MVNVMTLKTRLLLPLAGLFALPLSAQQASFVTMTGTNANYANGLMTANFFPPANSSQFDYFKYHFPFTVSAPLNSSGQWSMSLADTSSVLPASSQWRLQLCSAVTSGASTCFSVTTAVTCINNVSCSGTTLDLSSSFAGAPVPPGSGTVSSVTSTGGTLNVTNGGGPTANLDINPSHSFTWSANGALSVPAALYNGSPVTSGGTGTTTWLLVLIQPNGTTSTAWNTGGTMFGVNAASGFTGNIFDFQLGGSSKLSLSAAGGLTGGSSIFSTYQTGSNCANAASPAVCAAAASGSVAVPAGGATLTVNTTRVTANSQIQLTFDASLGARLSVTCNTAMLQPTVSARTAGTSFTITMSGTVSTNPDCISYTIFN